MSSPSSSDPPSLTLLPSSLPAGAIQLPDALLKKCFVPFTPGSKPELHGYHIAVQGTTPARPETTLLLSPPLIDLAAREIKAAIAKPFDSSVLRVTTLCTPKLGSPLAVDAAVRYLAHQFESDVVILDANDLADGEHGVLGTDLTRAIWSFFSRHYELSDELNARSRVEGQAKAAEAQLADQENVLASRKRALDELVPDNGVKREDASAATPVVGAINRRGDPGLDKSSSDTPSHQDCASSASAGTTEPYVFPFEHEGDLLHKLDSSNLADAERLVEQARENAISIATSLEALKLQHEKQGEARALEHANAMAWLCAFLRAGGEARRRFLYLRNFGATSYAFNPLIRPILTAISDCGVPVTVLAGFNRVPLLDRADSNDGRRVYKNKAKQRAFFTAFNFDTPLLSDNGHRVYQNKAKQDAFFKAFDSDTALLTYVKRKCVSEWRKPAGGNGRATSLSGLFSLAVLQRYYLRNFRRPRQEPLRMDVDFQLEHVAAIAVTLSAELLTPSEFPTRLVLGAHLPRLNLALRGNHERAWAPANHSMVEEWMELLKEAEPDTNASVVRLSTLEHNAQGLSAIAARVAPWLPQTDTVTTGDVFSAMQKSDIARQELKAYIDTERHGPPTAAEGTPSVVEQVKRSSDLSSYEKRLLGAIVDPATIHTTYEDVFLEPHIIETLHSVVSLPLIYGDAYNTGILGRESTAGVLLYGPPGTGKTMVCRALAKESGATMLQIQASTIRSRWHSEDEQHIQATFTLARRLGPCIIFIDEIEALLRSRSKATDINASTLTEFLQEMDGLKSASQNKASNIIVIGATNRPQDLDEAILRRLPRRLFVDLPGTSEREKIIKHYLTGENVDDTVNPAKLAERTPLYSGSDLKHLVVSAALFAFKDSVKGRSARGKDGTWNLPPRVIGAHHFEKALREIIASATTHLSSISELREWIGQESRVPDRDYFTRSATQSGLL